MQINDVWYAGREQQNRKAPIYVPVGGFVDIELASDVLFSFNQGAISKFVAAGVLTAEVFGLGSGSANTSNSVSLFEDWVSSNAAGQFNWERLSNGSGSGAFPSPSEVDADRPGVIELRTGTSPGGRGAVRLGRQRMTGPPPGGSMFSEWGCRLSDLGTIAEDFFINIGFSDNNSGGNGTNSIAFRYDGPGPNWQVFTRAGG